jgi:hypothetical protein
MRPPLGLVFGIVGAEYIQPVVAETGKKRMGASRSAHVVPYPDTQPIKDIIYEDQ